MDSEYLRNPNFEVVFTYPNSIDKIDYLTYSCISIYENQVDNEESYITADFYLSPDNVEFFCNEPCGKELNISLIFYKQSGEIIFCSKKKLYKIISTSLNLDQKVSGMMTIKVIFEEILN